MRKGNIAAVMIVNNKNTNAVKMLKEEIQQCTDNDSEDQTCKTVMVAKEEGQCHNDNDRKDKNTAAIMTKDRNTATMITAKDTNNSLHCPLHGSFRHVAEEKLQTKWSNIIL